MVRINERYARLLDEGGRILLLHHRSASKYYRWNMAFISVFLGVSFRNYYQNPAVFMSERLGKVYLSLIIMSIFGLSVFSKRHIRNIYLDPSGKELHVETYRACGLLDHSKERTIKIKNLRGNRIFLTPKLSVYQLEYIKEGKWDKRRSLFYRPEFIGDQDLWQTIRVGTEVQEVASSNVEISEEAQLLRKLKKKAEAKSKYK